MSLLISLLQAGAAVRQLSAGPDWSENLPLRSGGGDFLLPGHRGPERLDFLHQLLHTHPQHVLLPQVSHEEIVNFQLR